ncbi:MAG: NIPSNAP family protein [Acidobacteria bacterium]|nr:NIPSNAP family protein [Acidobacteriota bacterium]
MMRNALFAAIPLLGIFLAAQLPAPAQDPAPVYELRIYTTFEGKLPALLARFSNHTLKIFEKHGMENVGYWVPADAPRSQDTLYYILRHKSRDAAAASWAAFREDPDWIKARKDSEAAGKIVERVDSVFLSPADFSKLK